MASRNRRLQRQILVINLAGALACIPGREPEGRELTRSPAARRLQALPRQLRNAGDRTYMIANAATGG